ncbi:hypothetical protein [Haliangium ochraceum]|uniref:Capsule biosynthesis protein CapB n=1 Tax=Haliangium ochraceum (strain DSM 14365 / JCM 11303 / SMP-2) TaxID=502025 RepID=D0LFP2_HALO1|nr:hypothetical protein [Haliangium ochraceum]ACY12676.1 hypothetical protein Hoch_0034 [Haliangium ochraceum DSM 14365]
MLAKLFRSRQQRRIEAETFDPSTAPHRPLVAEILRAHMPPMQLRLRQRWIDELALRVLEFMPAPEPLQVADEVSRRVLLVSRTQQAILQLLADVQHLERQFDSLSSLLRETEDEDEQRLLMAEYLTQTVANPRKRQQDIKALRRFLDYDALRERDERERRKVVMCIELGAHFIATVIAALIAGERGEGALVESDSDSSSEVFRGALARLCREVHTPRFLAEVVRDNQRWQTRLPAARGLAALCGWAQRQDGPISSLIDSDTRSEIVAITSETATSDEENPWVRAAGLAATLGCDEQRGEQLLVESLRGRDAPLDFLYRRLILPLVSRALAPGHAVNVFDALIEPPKEREHVRLGAIGISRPEPSEHVRLGLAEVVLSLAPGEAITRLRRLAGLDGHDEASPKVRTKALLSARKLAAGALDLAVRDAASAVLVDALAAEVHSLPLRTICEELSDLAAELVLIDAEDHLDQLAPSWLDALHELLRHPRCAPPIAEAAANAIENIERERSHERRLVTQALRELSLLTETGRSRTFRLSKLPESVAEMVRDPQRIGRVLADLGRDGFGLGIRATRWSMTLWRGDYTTRRLWRILHELRNPQPNKRQAFLHTIGRTYRSTVRAHPGRLDEATATTVPGERVFVESEGSWGRHLPTVDDVLDLPLFRRRPVHICSSHGMVTMRPSRSFFRRLYARLAIHWRYTEWVTLRQSSIASDEPQQRRRFLERVQKRFDVDIEMSGYHDQAARNQALALNPAVANLFPAKALERTSAAMMALGAPLLAPFQAVRDWLDSNMPYFTSLTQNSQTALAVFLGAAATHYVGTAYTKRRFMDRARASFPLCIGGWGTRGKSGTERLKAALFHGLGFDVFVKTTGCEAMMLHAPPGQKPLEIFVYRPYDKATIWEQYDLVSLAHKLEPDVFLWECMALNPRYVNLLQHAWMRDDLITLTNAYPDHEDIQGPAGINVAEVISQFIPKHSTLITSELNFLPLFEEVCRQRKTRMIAVRERVGDLIADDMLAIFPYNEHPRNIAMVARMADELGVEPMLAIFAMAENVVADLGVLKAYPQIRVRSRLVAFVNGCSANERTGYLNSWRRMGLDAIDPDEQPESFVVTVVNNRADRISRSEVFARVLVRDVDVDRHVLIGTNVNGLMHFIDVALGSYLDDVSIIREDDFGGDGPVEQPFKRLRTQLKRLRIPKPTTEAAMRRLDLYAAGVNCVVADEQREAIEAAVTKTLSADVKATVAVSEVQRNLEGNRALRTTLEAALQAAPVGRASDEDIDSQLLSIETLEPAAKADAIEHFLRQLATLAVRARLEARLASLIERRATGELGEFDTAFRTAWRELFESKLVPIEAPETTGDQIIDRCARSIPPGTSARIMGTQNIKGTGLDFVYRWIAIESVVLALRALQSERSDRRLSALRELEAFSDHGMFDAGLARGMLAMQPVRQPSAEEISLRERIRSKLEAVCAARLTLLKTQMTRDSLDRVAGVVEGSVDYLDAIRRYRSSRRIMKDLAETRISHGRAAQEMRTLVARQKGGWLAKTLRKQLAALKRES